MKLKIARLSIDRFRLFKQLKIEGLGRVNLITGRNNTGKSSILEALRILASDASLAVLSSILRYREEDTGEAEEITRTTDLEGLSQFASLFNGFPQLTDAFEPIVLSANGTERPLHLTIAFDWLSEKRDQEGAHRFVLRQPHLFGSEQLTPALVIESGADQRFLPLDYLRRFTVRGRFLRSELADEPRMPCVFVSPYGGERTTTLGPLWDKIALTDREQDVVKALRIVAADIEAVSMVGGEGPRQMRTAVVRSAGYPRPIPLRSFGDGLNRLFGIVLSLVNAKGGLLLIDEFENGMHHTVQLDVWRVIFRLAQQLNVQVFASSHSWDAIEAFQRAANEDPEEGLLIRLSRMGDSIIPTLFREQELAVATRDRIEVR